MAKPALKSEITRFLVTAILTPLVFGLATSSVVIAFVAPIAIGAAAA